MHAVHELSNATCKHVNMPLHDTKYLVFLRYSYGSDTVIVIRYLASLLMQISYDLRASESYVPRDLKLPRRRSDISTSSLTLQNYQFLTDIVPG